MSLTCRLVWYGLQREVPLLDYPARDFHRFHSNPTLLLWFLKYLLTSNMSIEEVMRLAARNHPYHGACDHFFTALDGLPKVMQRPQIKGPYLRALFLRKHAAVETIGHHQAALFDRCKAAEIKEPLDVIPPHLRTEVEQRISDARTRPAPADYLGQGGILRRDARALANRIKDPEMKAQFLGMLNALGADGRRVAPKGPKPPPKPLTAEAARAEVSYNPKTGDIIDNATGKPAQAYLQKGTPWFKVCGRLVAVHKLAFLLVTGRMPNGRVVRLKPDVHPSQDNSAKNLQWGLPEDQAAWTGIPVTGINAVLRQSGITLNKSSKRFMVRVVITAPDGSRGRKCIASTRTLDEAAAVQREYLAAQQS